LLTGYSALEVADGVGAAGDGAAGDGAAAEGAAGDAEVGEAAVVGGTAGAGLADTAVAAGADVAVVLSPPPPLLLLPPPPQADKIEAAAIKRALDFMVLNSKMAVASADVRCYYASLVWCFTLIESLRIMPGRTRSVIAVHCHNPQSQPVIAIRYASLQIYRPLDSDLFLAGLLDVQSVLRCQQISSPSWRL
jgi:hypothetical protein